MRYAALLGLILWGCSPTFDAPDSPPHDDSRDGAGHAALAERPFLCPTGDPAAPSTGGRRERNEVPSRVCIPSATRPPDRLLSCDSVGCHGGYDHTTDPLTTVRHLRGSNGPSCYTCHGEEWDED